MTVLVRSFAVPGVALADPLRLGRTVERRLPGFLQQKLGIEELRYGNPAFLSLSQKALGQCGAGTVRQFSHLGDRRVVHRHLKPRGDLTAERLRSRAQFVVIDDEQARMVDQRGRKLSLSVDVVAERVGNFVEIVLERIVLVGRAIGLVGRMPYPRFAGSE
jgi:hypothetical protein